MSTHYLSLDKPYVGYDSFAVISDFLRGARGTMAVFEFGSRFSVLGVLRTPKL